VRQIGKRKITLFNLYASYFVVKSWWAGTLLSKAEPPSLIGGNIFVREEWGESRGDVGHSPCLEWGFVNFRGVPWGRFVRLFCWGLGCTITNPVFWFIFLGLL